MCNVECEDSNWNVEPCLLRLVLVSSDIVILTPHSQYCFMRANLDNELEYPIDEETFESLTEKVLEQAILMRAAFQVDEDNEAAIARVSRSKGQ